MSQEIKKYYNGYARYYDRNHLRKNSARLYIEKKRKEVLLPMVNKSGLILDVACGTGYYLKIFGNKKSHIIGGDISQKMAKVCKSKNLRNIYVGSYEQIPFKDEVFDIILCINAFQYAENPKRVLEEVSRVLKREGIAVLTFFNLLNFRSVNLIRRFFTSKFSPALYEKRYFYWQTKKMGREAKLRVIDVAGINFLVYPINEKRRNKRALDMFDRLDSIIRRTLLMHFASEIIIKLRKTSYQS